MRDENHIRTLGDYFKPRHEGYRNTIELHVGNNVVPLRSDTIWLVQNGCSFHRLRSEDPNQNLKDLLKLVDSLYLDGSITTWKDLTSRFLAQFFPPGRTIKICNDIQMFQQHHEESLSEAWTHFKDLLQKVPHHGIDLWLQPTQVNKITTSCDIYSVPHDTQYCIEDLEQAFVEYASSCTDEAGCSINAITIHFKKQSNSYDKKAKENEEEENNSPENIHVNPSTPPDPSVVSSLKKYSNSIHSSNHSDWFLNYPTPRNPIITKGYPSNLKIPCNIRHVNMGKAYCDPNSPLNIMTRMTYNSIMRRKLDPMENTNRRVSNFIGKIKRMHVIVGNFTYIVDFMIVEDISAVIDPRLSHVVLGKPFVEMSNMTHDSPEERILSGSSLHTILPPNMVDPLLSLQSFIHHRLWVLKAHDEKSQAPKTCHYKEGYYVKRLNYNLFFVGQFCDADLEVAFRKSTRYIRDLKGNDLLACSRDTDLYSITLQDTSTPNLICLMAKATSSQSWLWHRCLSHLNFDTINLLSKYDILTGLPKLKFVKDHLCSSCELRKIKPETVTTSNELNLLFSLFDELLNGTTKVVSKSFAANVTNAPDKLQQHNTNQSTTTTVAADIPPLNIQTTPETTSQAPTQAPIVTTTKNINQAETNKENAQVEED
uniref:Integrase, catalytic region, zinc finger, CCHC-type, peptidase aspartic, catalytic n=1 Tax=Tanacetum cinerariifolium TaxID=118510 RepID=A0A6L2K2J8_TANCI|nr:integrase, catalytic region, zinc finger, CCHC-type, peptidase aspartic, catalytic [Tanacetum cinerariifolium]